MSTKSFSLSKVVFLGLIMLNNIVSGLPDYGDALAKSLLYFEAQRSGKLPHDQRITWRKDSALEDGSDAHMNLVGGYYDAGDNVKFHFPMAFTTTMLAWSVIEFGQSMGTELSHAEEAVWWGSQYLFRATYELPYKIAAQVGNAVADHNCWERPEDMDTPRVTYFINQTHPGSELSGEMAAALAASSMVFKSSNPILSKELLQRAEMAFKFADTYQGSYSDSIGEAVCPFYCDFGGYADELIWAAAWLYKATNSKYYLNYVYNNLPMLNRVYKRTSSQGESYYSVGSTEFGWDAKDAGISVLLSKTVMDSVSNPFVSNAEKFVCSILPESPTKSVQFSPGGLIVKPGAIGNLQHATSLSFLAVVYGSYLQTANNKPLNCGGSTGVVVSPSRLVTFAKSQVDYILGNNPLGLSYMVGFGDKYPQFVHHRASTNPSINEHPKRIVCQEGYNFLDSKQPNPNILMGAIVGGPDINDHYNDDRRSFEQSEPATYYTAPFVGVLAYLKGLSTK